MFNSFLCTFLNIFQASFPVKHKSMRDKNDWITRGIKIHCEHKSSLYAFSKNSKDTTARAHYNNYYCEILRKVTTKTEMKQ